MTEDAIAREAREIAEDEDDYTDANWNGFNYPVDSDSAELVREIEP